MLVRLVGEFTVQQGDGVLVGPCVGSLKARTLLTMLAAEGGSSVGPDAIVEALWGQAPPARPMENVATLVSRLRARLGLHVITGGRDGYRLGAARVDLYVAEDLLRTRTIPADARRALHLLDGEEFLPAHRDALWARQPVALHQALLWTARQLVADHALAQGDLKTARTVAEAALSTDPLDESACRTLMTAHHREGEPVRALIAYELLRRNLSREKNTQPGEQTRRLHTAILQRDA